MAVTNRSKPEDENRIESDAHLPTEAGNFRVRVTKGQDGKEHSLLYTGLDSTSIPLVRIHSECLTGDAFGSLKCDCGPQLKRALNEIQDEGVGLILYLRQEGRGIGLINKLKAYKLQEEGYDTLEANLELGFKGDARDYGVGAQILISSGVKKMKLLTNNPKKRTGLIGYGLEITKPVPIEVECNIHNEDYLKTKKQKKEN